MISNTSLMTVKAPSRQTEVFPDLTADAEEASLVLEALASIEYASLGAGCRRDEMLGYLLWRAAVCCGRQQ